MPDRDGPSPSCRSRRSRSRSVSVATVTRSRSRLRSAVSRWAATTTARCGASASTSRVSRSVTRGSPRRGPIRSTPRSTPLCRSGDVEGRAPVARRTRASRRPSGVHHRGVRRPGREGDRLEHRGHRPVAGGLEAGADAVHQRQRIGALAQHRPVDQPPEPVGHREDQDGHHRRGDDQGKRPVRNQPGQHRGQAADGERDQQGERDVEQGPAQHHLDAEEPVAQHARRRR